MGRILTLIWVFCCSFASAQQVYEVSSGTIKFNSKAPQELIHASSDNLMGVIDMERKTFAFKIGISSFMGFNSPLQREHFNENYMETEVFPEASYSGKIIEDVDLTKDGVYEVRAKGKLRIHGVEQERIIRSTITSKKGRVSIQSDFVVLLADHNIKIPKVVHSKLSPEINVTVSATLVQRN